MSNIEIIDLIKYANENQPVNFASALDDILSQKTLEALATKREEVAANMFNGPDDEEYDQDHEEDEDEEEYELEDDGESDD